MTTLISRLFADEATAQRAVKQMMFRGFPSRSCILISDSDTAEAHLARAKVHESAIAPYAAAIAAGNVALIVQATYKPLGAARLARDIMGKLDPLDASGATEEHVLPWQPDHAPSVMKDHPLFFSVVDIPVPHGPITANFGMRMTKPHRTKRPLSNKRASRLFWPMPLVSKKKRSNSDMSGGRKMSRMFWPMPLLSSKPRRKSVIPGGGTPFSSRFGLRTVS